MDLSTLIEVALGMILMWIMLSLATIQIQEVIMTWMDKRAKDMEASIHEMLANPNLKSQFYDHPVIRGLTAKKRKKPSPVPARFYQSPIVQGFTQEIRKFPSYIPSQDFAVALFDVVMTAGTESSIIQQGILKIRDDLEDEFNTNRWRKTKEQAIIDDLNILADIARSAAATEAGTSITNYTKEVLTRRVNLLTTFYRNQAKNNNIDKDKKERLLDIADKLDRALRLAKIIANTELKKVKQAIDDADSSPNGKTGSPGEKITSVEDVLTELRRGVSSLSVISPELTQSLSALMLNVEDYAKEGESQIAKGRENVEKWFNSSMDRVSGVFKRYTQVLALVLGIILSLLLNVNSIRVAQYLWHEPSVRQALAAAAVATATDQQNSNNQTEANNQTQKNPVEIVQSVTQEFAIYKLPIGWDLQKYGGEALYDSNCQLFPRSGQFFGIPVFKTNWCVAPSQATNQTNIAMNLFGIFLTAAATAMGAPFWFDILKKIVNLRSTGPNPVEKGASK